MVEEEGDKCFQVRQSQVAIFVYFKSIPLQFMSFSTSVYVLEYLGTIYMEYMQAFENESFRVFRFGGRLKKGIMRVCHTYDQKSFTFCFGHKDTAVPLNGFITFMKYW